MTTNLIIIAITCIISYLAFNDRKLLDKLILWPPAVSRHSEYHRLITHGFIHADFQHLLFNMITLYFFGRALEGFYTNYLGAFGFAIFYIGGIIAAILPAYYKHQKDAHYRTLGASGAVSAVLFAYILLQPWNLIFVFFIPIPAILYAVLYVGYSIYMDMQQSDNVNHSAHLFGAAYGVLFTLVMEPRVLGVFIEQLLNPSFG